MPFTVTMPKLSPTMSEGVVAKWHKRIGDRVESGDVLLEIATDKATVEHAALDEGYLRKIIVPDGQKAVVNEPLAIFTETADESIEGYQPQGVMVEAPKVEAKAAPVAAAPKHTSERVMASPLAKKLAKEQGIDLHAVQGTGPSGRIMSRDLAQTKPAAVAGTTVVQELSMMRKVIGQRLQESKQTIPHFYVRQGIDAEALVNLREELKKFDLNYTINDFILKACAIALKKHPEVNSGYDSARNAAIRFSQVDISVAVTIAGGLITPILFNAATKSMAELSLEMKTLAVKAREGKLTPQEFQGGSFTVSNLGMFGITEMTAIINPPQGAILGVGAISDVPVVKNGAIVPGKKMVLTLSCDHRIIDGAEGAQFMRTLKQLLENPVLFLSE
jgi:pyruvate dehydrogenase E2 component (dihydrolipoamide acetyltransferase)